MLSRAAALPLLSPLGAFAASGFIVEPAGQATGDTCQSYSLAVALATKRDAAFKFDTAAELRKAEVAIRSSIKKAAGQSSVTHAHIQSGFSNYTSGNYELKFSDVEEADIGDVISSATGITSAQMTPATFLLGAIVKDVMLASATKIGADSYGAGHIFTIYGVDGPPNSNRRYLILNSGLKVKDKRYTCQDGLPDDPGDYSAWLGWTKSADIKFKSLGTKVRLWRIEKRQ